MARGNNGEKQDSTTLSLSSLALKPSIKAVLIASQHQMISFTPADAGWNAMAFTWWPCGAFTVPECVHANGASNLPVCIQSVSSPQLNSMAPWLLCCPIIRMLTKQHETKVPAGKISAFLANYRRRLGAEQAPASCKLTGDLLLIVSRLIQCTIQRLAMHDC